MSSPYHLNKLGSGGFAGGEAARKPPIFPYLKIHYIPVEVGK